MTGRLSLVFLIRQDHATLQQVSDWVSVDNMFMRTTARLGALSWGAEAEASLVSC